MREEDGRIAPPPLARRLLRWAVGRREADEVEGELGEAFRERAATDGPRAARGWYRRQVAGFVLRSPKGAAQRSGGGGHGLDGRSGRRSAVGAAGAS